MISAPSLTSVALLLGLSLFLGLAFEEFFARTDTKRPGGIRTFPMLAFGGGVLYLLDPNHFIPFTGGLVVLGAWLTVFYRQHLREQDEEGEPNVGLVVPALNVHAYLLGAIALALPPWVAVTFTVSAVLLLTGREKLHALARRVELEGNRHRRRIFDSDRDHPAAVTQRPVTTLTSITPRHAWLALVVVCTLSYASYLAQRYWTPAASGLWMAALGGAYSSTATTVVLAPPGQNRIGDAPKCAGRHHTCYRHHVSAHSHRHRRLQYGAGANAGAAPLWPFTRGAVGMRAAVLAGATGVGRQPMRHSRRFNHPPSTR